MFVEALATPLPPEEAALRLAPDGGLLWLDGTHPAPEGRWSFVTSQPREMVRVPMGAPDPLRTLDALWAAQPPSSPAPQGAPSPAEVPHWAGFIGYDAFFGGRPSRLSAQRTGAALCFGRYPALYAYDNAAQRGFVVGDDRSACRALAKRLARPTPASPQARVGPIQGPDPPAHARAIEQALEHIAAGDIYQVNLARRWTAPLEGSPLALALAMRKESPVPLGFTLSTGARTLIVRTMERFLRWNRSEATLITRPIKGTLARTGNDPAGADQLRADPKEQAEHAMIVDLMRNDLGRVAQVGSVEVRDVMTVEPYEKLYHLVSTVRCKTRPDLSAARLLQATFPPGSVTGTPKLRAIEIIDALEPVPRGVYCGAVGYLDRTGGLSLAVALRAAIAEAGSVSYYAGGGLVEASQPERELAETELKARVFVDACAHLQGPGRDNSLSTRAFLR